jgi:hypothetical protein
MFLASLTLFNLGLELEGANQGEREKGNENPAEVKECRSDEELEGEKKIVQEDDGETRKGQKEKVW